MLINNRPESQAELYLLVEDVEARMSEEEQGIVLGYVKQFWGGKWGEDQEEWGGGQGENGERRLAEQDEEDGYYGGEGEGDEMVE